MLSRYFAAVFVILSMVSSGVAVAQDCTIAAYADPAGTRSIAHYDASDNWDGTHQFSIWVVLFTEDTVAAAAYRIYIRDLGTSLFIQDRIAGPSGSGLILDEDPASIGTNVALAECVIGFGGHPVLVEEYVMVALPQYGGGSISLGQNANQNPDYPQYVTCNHVQKDCMVGPSLLLETVLPVESKSFSSIKSLYH